MISQCVSMKNPTKLLPTVVPKRPHIKMRQTAIALTCVGNKETAPFDMTEIETPASTKKHENDVTASMGSVHQSRARPHAPEPNKQNAEIFTLKKHFSFFD